MVEVDYVIPTYVIAGFLFVRISNACHVFLIQLHVLNVCL